MKNSKSILDNLPSEKVDFVNLDGGLYRPHLMRRSPSGGVEGGSTTFPNKSQLNFELNLRKEWGLDR
jgi:hypothetical protein